MEWIDDAKACLDVADNMLDEANDLQELAFSDENYIPFLKVKIKNFLENCRSPLDYTAQYAFDTYCKMEYSKKERRKIKVYFPIRQTKNEFEEVISESFRNLAVTNPTLNQIFLEAQPFQNSEWLQDLNRLVNKNKHRYLTKHESRRTSKIENMSVGGVKFSNVTLISNGTDIRIGNQPYNFGDPNPPQTLIYDNATVSREFVFTDLDKPVLTALGEILDGTKHVVTQVESGI